MLKIALIFMVVKKEKQKNTYAKNDP